MVQPVQWEEGPPPSIPGQIINREAYDEDIQFRPKGGAGGIAGLSASSLFREGDIGLDVEAMVRPMEKELRAKHGENLLARVSGLGAGYQSAVDKAGAYSMDKMGRRMALSGQEALQGVRQEHQLQRQEKVGVEKQKSYKRKETQAQVLAALSFIQTAATKGKTLYDAYKENQYLSNLSAEDMETMTNEELFEAFEIEHGVNLDELIAASNTATLMKEDMEQTLTEQGVDLGEFSEDADYGDIAESVADMDMPEAEDIPVLTKEGIDLKKPSLFGFTAEELEGIPEYLKLGPPDPEGDLATSVSSNVLETLKAGGDEGNVDFAAINSELKKLQEGGMVTVPGEPTAPPPITQELEAPITQEPGPPISRQERKLNQEQADANEAKYAQIAADTLTTKLLLASTDSERKRLARQIEEFGRLPPEMAAAQAVVDDNEYDNLTTSQKQDITEAADVSVHGDESVKQNAEFSVVGDLGDANYVELQNGVIAKIDLNKYEAQSSLPVGGEPVVTTSGMKYVINDWKPVAPSKPITAYVPGLRGVAMVPGRQNGTGKPINVVVSQRLQEPILRMQQDALNDGIDIALTSGLRTPEEQFAEHAQKYIDNHGNRMTALEAIESGAVNAPHVMGIGIDVMGTARQHAGKDIDNWMTKNAYKYGFVRNPRDLGAKEDHHWVYVGDKEASVMRQNPNFYREFFFSPDKVRVETQEFTKDQFERYKDDPKFKKLWNETSELDPILLKLENPTKWAEKTFGARYG
jgi:hypothetical protein